MESGGWTVAGIVGLGMIIKETLFFSNVDVQVLFKHDLEGLTGETGSSN